MYDDEIEYAAREAAFRAIWCWRGITLNWDHVYNIAEDTYHMEKDRLIKLKNKKENKS